MPRVSEHQAAPWPDPPPPGGVDAPLDECGAGEGERNGRADIAEVEERRVEGEAGILQKRVQVTPILRQRPDAHEWVGGEDGEEQEAGRHHAEHGEHAGLQRRRQVPPEARHRAGAHGEDQHPQHHRAFVVPPRARELVEHRLQRVAVLVDVLHREIRHREGPHQAAERECDEQHVRDRGGRAGGHQQRAANLPARRADERQHRLRNSEQQRKHQREMAKFGDHARLPSVSSSAVTWGRGKPPPAGRA